MTDKKKTSPIEVTDSQEGDYTPVDGFAPLHVPAEDPKKKEVVAAKQAPLVGAAHLDLLNYLEAIPQSTRGQAIRALLKQIERAAKKVASRSRADRWADACGTAREGLDELASLKEEYEEWRDNLPENLQQSALGEKLQAVCDLDLDSAVSMIDEAEGMDLPLGFGRD